MKWPTHQNVTTLFLFVSSKLYRWNLLLTDSTWQLKHAQQMHKNQGEETMKCAQPSKCACFVVQKIHIVSHVHRSQPKKKKQIKNYASCPMCIGSNRTKNKNWPVTKKNTSCPMCIGPNRTKTKTSSTTTTTTKSTYHCSSILFLDIAVLRALWGPCGACSQSLPTEDDPSVEDNRRSQCW
mgnify:CR=1 FL=1